MLSRIHSTRNIIRHATGVRQLYRDSNSPKPDTTEFDIPVPWGKVAAKWWGPKDRQPILALHGSQDNLATFDTLVPLFPEGTSVLAIDWPGHGNSSWLPPGGVYSLLDCFLLLRGIVKSYKWNKVKLLGHSMGSMATFLYSTYCPNEVQFSIGIDLIKPPSIRVNEYCDVLLKSADYLLKVEGRTTPPPSYGFEEIMHRWIRGTDYSLDEAACRILMKRGVKEVEQDEYIFTKDPRLIKQQNFDPGYTHPHILELAERITCPYRIIKAESSPFYQRKEYVLETVEAMKKNSVDFVYTVVPGKHHLHLTHPERVVKVLNPFLEKYNI